MAGPIPPQFMKKASSAPTLPKDKKKQARQAAIAAMQKQDQALDAKLGANDTPAPAAAPAKGSQPPWLKKGN